MKKFDGIIICSDFDHTISSNTFKFWENDDFLSAVPQNNIDAVKYFVENGGTFAIVSGRNPDEMMRVGELMPIAPYMVVSNGTALYSIEENRAVESETMNESFRDVALYLCQKVKELSFLRVTDNDFIFRFYRRGGDMEEVLDSAKFPVYKAIIESTDTAMVKRCFDLASEKFGDRFSIEMSGVATLEICPKGSSKGKMAKKLIALLERERGEKFKKVICVGDNQNDIDLVKLGDIGYAVGNAIDALKAVAHRVTVPSSEGAIEYIVKDIENEL
ncbi:MAG: HAD-IIB family hydrolase [Clostridia bacterium]|nr:HAD-IIB family hydrolase [Clostridia bacterium]